MSVKTGYRIGAVQVSDIQGDVEAALAIIEHNLKKAEAEGLTILCFPECFLQGYTLDSNETKRRAMNLSSSAFQEILDALRSYRTTVIFGVIEEEAGAYFNTAVVIKEGKLLGTYRKVHLFEKNFESGEDYPVFTVDGLTFGINICYDARFSEGAQILAEQGASVIFYPLNNRLPIEKAIKYREKHLPNLVDRAKEANCWIVSSDVIADDGKTIGYGCTAVVDPSGKVVDRVAELREGIVVVANS